jgi:type IV secretion system protein VirD4
LFFVWLFLKLGTAYRLAMGDGVGMKLIGMTHTVGPAFADAAPGLFVSDWLVGIAGAVLVRLLIWQKSKKAENSERMWNTDRPAGDRKRRSNRL